MMRDFLDLLHTHLQREGSVCGVVPESLHLPQAIVSQVELALDGIQLQVDVTAVIASRGIDTIRGFQQLRVIHGDQFDVVGLLELDDPRIGLFAAAGDGDYVDIAQVFNLIFQIVFAHVVVDG